MRGIAAAVLLFAVACGGNSGPTALAGCWNYELRDTGAVAGSGAMHVAKDMTGDFTLTTALAIKQPSSPGLVFASLEPNGNYALQLYVDGSPSRLVFDVVGEAVSAPLSGNATSYELSRSFAFTAARCP